MEELELDNLPIKGSDPELSDQDLSTQISAQSVSESFPQLLLKEAIGYLGINRENDLTQIAKFLELFDLPTKQGNSWIPFCCAGASYAACKAYCVLNNIQFTADNSVEVFKTHLPQVKAHYFLPSASCGFVMQDAQKRGTWLPKNTTETINPGDLVLYNWAGGTWPDHIGIVENKANELHTVEFNTSTANNINGGAVSRRTRNYNCVLGYVKLS